MLPLSYHSFTNQEQIKKTWITCLFEIKQFLHWSQAERGYFFHISQARQTSPDMNLPSRNYKDIRRQWTHTDEWKGLESWLHVLWSNGSNENTNRPIKTFVIWASVLDVKIMAVKFVVYLWDLKANFMKWLSCEFLNCIHIVMIMRNYSQNIIKVHQCSYFGKSLS